MLCLGASVLVHVEVHRLQLPETHQEILRAVTRSCLAGIVHRMLKNHLGRATVGIYFQGGKDMCVGVFLRVCIDVCVYVCV